MKTLIKKLIPVSIRLWIESLPEIIFGFFCSFLPVKNRVLFYSIRGDGELVENAKALYEKVGGEKIIFVSKLPHSKKESFKAIRLLKTSRIIVTDDYCKYMRTANLKKKQKLIQIWHAAGSFKCFGLDAPSLLNEKNERKTHKRYNLVCVTGEGCIPNYASAFGIDKSRIKALGMPSTDEIINNPDKMREQVYADFPYLKNKTIYLYAPTFREENGSVCAFDPEIDFDNLDKNLKDDEIFIICRHPLDKADFPKEKYEKIIDMTGTSTSLLSSAASVMITDYSSVVYYAALFNVPTVFYCPDFDTYERNFYLDFPEDFPGELIRKDDELLSKIRQIKEKPPIEKMSSFRKSQMSACDGKSAERIAKVIECL